MYQLVLEGDEVGQAGLAFHEPVLTGPDPLLVPHMLHDYIQVDLFHHVSWHQGQADSTSQ